MKFGRLTLSNFGSVGSASVDLQEQGLVFVDGDNQDVADDPAFESNGSGKSWTFSESIYWCLFGRTLRRVPPDGVILKGHEDTYVQLELEIGKRSVVVMRTRGHNMYGNSLRITVDGEDQTGSTTRLSEKVLAGLIHPLNEQLFRFTILFGQGMPDRFSQLTDSQRKDIIDEIVRVHIYERARQHSRKLAEQMHRRAHSLELRLEQMDKNREDAQARLNRMESGLSVLEKSSGNDRREEAKLLEEQILNLRLAIGYVSEARERLLERRDHLLDIVHGITKAESRIIRELSVTKGDYRSLREPEEPAHNCPTCGQVVPEENLQKLREEYEVRFNAFRKRVKKLRRKAKKIRKMDSLVKYHRQDVESELNRIRKRLEASSRDVSEMADEVTSLQEKVDKIVRFSVGQESLELVQATVKEMREHLEGLEKEADPLRKQMEADTEEGNLYDILQKGFYEMRAIAIEDALVFLNGRLAHYLSVLTNDNVEAELELQDGKIVLLVSTRGGNYNSCSGGEQDRVDIAMSFALNDLAFAISGISTNLVVCDEPGGFLDRAGTRKMVALLAEKAKTVGSVVFMSQRTEVKAIVPRRWTVRKVNGISSLDMRK